MEIEFKTCHQCGIEQPVSSFHKNKNSRDGHVNYCKSCVKARTATYREENRDSILKKKHDYYVANAEAIKKKCAECRIANLDWYRQKKQAWEDRNREKVREIRRNAMRRMRQSNPEKVAAASKRWREKNSGYLPSWRAENPESISVYNRNRHARVKNSVGKFSPKEWRELCAKYGHCCLRCKKRKPLTVDHVVALSKGGENNISNIQPLCGSCNSWKGARQFDFR